MGHGDRWGSGTSSGPSLSESNITEPILLRKVMHIYRAKLKVTGVKIICDTRVSLRMSRYSVCE